LPLGGFPAAGVDWVVWVDVVALAGAVVEAVASVDKALGSLETMVAVAAVVEQALNARSAMIISEAKILQTFSFFTPDFHIFACPLSIYMLFPGYDGMMKI